MAEFCLDCLNKLNHTHLTEEDVVLSEDLDFCEECVQLKPVIIIIGKRKKRRKIRGRRQGRPLGGDAA